MILNCRHVNVQKLLQTVFAHSCSSAFYLSDKDPFHCCIWQIYNLAYFIELLTIAFILDRNDFAMVPLGAINMKR